ncbi:MAG: pentapeptide repeat-containing protein [Magnetospirillum sp.]
MSQCPSCFGESESADGQPCSRCGWHAGKEVDGPYLAIGSLLGGKYRVGRCLGAGGFGITYLCRDENLKALVAIKEYFPAQLVQRGMSLRQVASFTGKYDDYSYGLEQFLREAQMLATYRDHAGIVSILDYFPENGTGYMVMEYLDGYTFEEYLKERQGKLPWVEVLNILTPVMDALRAVHSHGVVHRDVSPENILLLRDGRVKVIDFGAARRALKQKSQALSIILREGYAPFEQYQTQGEQGPWTDVYALAATFYRALTGQLPPMATDRVANDRLVKPSALGVALPSGVERALLKGLAVMKGDRYQDMGAFLHDLRRAQGGEQKASPSPGPSKPVPWKAAAALGGVLVIAGLAWVLMPGSSEQPAAPVVQPAQPVQTAQPVAAPPPVQKPAEILAPKPVELRQDVAVLLPGGGGEAKAKCPQSTALYASAFSDDSGLGTLECGRKVTVLGNVLGAPRTAIQWEDGTAYVASSALVPFTVAAPRPTKSEQATAKATPTAVAAPTVVAATDPAASADCSLSSAVTPRRNLAGCDLSGRNLHGAALKGANLSKANLSGADLSGADLSNTNLQGANLSGADLREAKLELANADGADLRNAKMGKRIRKFLFRHANLTGTDLHGVKFIDSVGDGANFSRTNLVDAEFPSTSVKGAVFSGADLKDTYWARADLTDADLRQAKNVSVDDMRKAYACDTDLYTVKIRVCSPLGGIVESLASKLIKEIAAEGGEP